MTRAEIRKRVCRPLAFPVLLATSLLLALPPAPIATASPAREAAASPAPVSTPVATGTTTATLSPSLTIALTTITPSIAIPNAAVIITGGVRNTGAVPVAAPVAHAFLGQNPLTSRTGVTIWATSENDESGSEVARTALGKALKPGSLTRFALTIPATAISHRESFAVLPLRIEVAGRTATSAQENRSLHTFLPALSSTKAYEPVAVAWLVPLTLDADPALHGMDSAARTTAWKKAIGPGSRLDRLIRGTSSTNVTWAIDPAILGPPRPPSTDVTSKTPGPAPVVPRAPATDSAASTDQVTEATTALARRLRTAAPRHTLWSLPYADPDLSAILPLNSDNSALTALIDRPSALPLAIGRARTDVAWPAEGTLNAQNEARLERAFDSPRLAAAVTSASSLTSLSSSTSNASRRSSAGLPLLAYDEALSRTATQTSSTPTGALAIQRFLADSMALLGERPGTPDRSVLVAFPRTFAGDPAVLRSFFAAIAAAPWLVPTTTERVLATSKALDPELPAFGASGSAALPAPTPGRPDPLSPGRSRLTSAELESIPHTTSAIVGVASIRDDARLFQSRWTDAQDQLLAARWRDHPSGPAAIKAATTTAISTISRSVTVVPSSVNFFADRGVLQVTVVNALDIPIHDVHLTLTPAQPRLRIEQQPGPLKIGARSRTNVRLEVTSIAAGLVRIEARLTTSNGTALGQNARVDVRVQPTSTWIYWVLGGFASVILILGIYRSLRRGSTRASRPAAQELPLHD